MTLLFFDGFETYGTLATLADGMEDVYDTLSEIPVTAVSIITSDRILNGQAIRLENVTQNTTLSFAKGPQLAIAGLSSQDDWVFGAAFRAPGGLGASGKIRPLFEILDSESARMVELRVDDAGNLTV